MIHFCKEKNAKKQYNNRISIIFDVKFSKSNIKKVVKY
jgi:hypothetical protein